MIESALAQAATSRESIDCICVGLGPGSYTGIRVAISVAQGWQLAREVKLLGVSSVECLAQQASESGHVGTLNVAIDAQRGEFYLAGYTMSESMMKVDEPLRIVSAAEVQARISSAQKVIGPRLSVFFVGACEMSPHAATLARLAAERTDFLPGEQLEPIYLRPTSFVKAPPPRVVPPL